VHCTTGEGNFGIEKQTGNVERGFSVFVMFTWPSAPEKGTHFLATYRRSS